MSNDNSLEKSFQDPKETIEKIMKEIQETNVYAEMGTGIEEGMSRLQQKTVKAEFETLRTIMKTFDKGLDATMTKKELFDFYQANRSKYQWPLFEFEDNYAESILDILGHKNEYVISVKDFISQTIILKEKLKIKKAKLAQDLQNLIPKIAEIEDQCRKHQKVEEEKTQPKIQLGITLFEGSDIPGNEFSDYIIKLSVENQSKTSKLTKFNNGAPVWQENFNFTLTKRNQILLIELISKSFQQETIGTQQIVLEDLDIEQQRVEQTFELEALSGKNPNAGTIRLKLHYVYDCLKYFKCLYNTANNQKAKLLDCFKILEQLDESFKTPFGILMSNQIDNIIDLNHKTILEKNEELDNISPNVRKSVLRNSVYPDIPRNTLNDMLVSNTFISQLKTKNLSTISFICICTSLLLSFFITFTKPNLISIIFVIWALLYYRISDFSGIAFYIGFAGLILSEILDLSYLIFSYESCWLKTNIETRSIFYSLAYCFTIINLGVKIEIIYSAIRTRLNQKKELYPH